MKIKAAARLAEKAANKAARVSAFGKKVGAKLEVYHGLELGARHTPRNLKRQEVLRRAWRRYGRLRYGGTPGRGPWA